MSQDRKRTFKLPPTSFTDTKCSQEARRTKALEEQKRRRAKRIDASRQLDMFADLTLGPSDDELAAPDEEPEVVREGVAQYASMLPSPSPGPSQQTHATHLDQGGLTASHQESKGKKGKKKKNRGGDAKPSNKWADKCMYAELLEMKEDNPWSDGLPQDLEEMVAVGPIPVGKRCLAVTGQFQLSGVAVVPNTTLRSRLQGKSLLPAFPSSLPPLTVLDCILDANWHQNGIVHVLDVIKWKGQDVSDCETSFRFWWRDTRLAELLFFPPPPSAPSPPQDQNQTPVSSLTVHPNAIHPPPYRFPYPTTFISVPCYSDTSLTSLSNSIIPLARTERYIPLNIPVSPVTGPADASDSSMSMDVDEFQHADNFLTTPLEARTCTIQSDGLLLYVAQASYEPGTSPLSMWIPVRPYHQQNQDGSANLSATLDVFERLIKRRLMRKEGPTGVIEVDMDAA